MGGKHRRLIGAAGTFADDSIDAIRAAAIEEIAVGSAIDAATLAAEQERLAARIRRFGAMADAVDIWAALGIADPGSVPGMPPDAFIPLADRFGVNGHDAR